MSRAQHISSGFSAFGFSAVVGPNFAGIVGLLLGAATVYLAARHIGPWAAALASAGWSGLLGLIARRQAVSLMTAMREQVLLAWVDDLTSLSNDRSFREKLRDLNSSRTGLTLALIDVDQFKAYNDAFGHPAGDEALKEIGRILAKVSGKSIWAYRIGGDEFALIFPMIKGPDPLETAELIRNSVAKHDWPRRTITVSIGVASIDEDEASSLLDRADRRLYRAKHEGGNRVIHQPTEGLPSG